LRLRLAALPAIREASAGHVAHGDGDRLLLPDHHHKPLAPGHPGVEQIALEHCGVLRQHGDHDGRVFGALALVNGRRIGRHQGVELDKSVGDRATVEAGDELAAMIRSRASAS
jgi:hypothetical protein